MHFNPNFPYGYAQQPPIYSKSTDDTVNNVVNGICDVLNGRTPSIHYPPNQTENTTFNQLAVSGALLATILIGGKLLNK